MKVTHALALSLVALLGVTRFAHSQTLAVDFVADYSIVDLGAPPGVPTNLGGITFLDNDTLLIGGAANGALGAIYQIDVTRDPVSNSINGFNGVASLYATAVNIDGGLAFGPGGVLFFTGYPDNRLSQIKPGSSSEDKIINLNTTTIAGSVGTLQFVPAGFAGAGQLKVISYNTGYYYTVGLTPDGTGTYDIATVSPLINVGRGPEGLVYIAGENAGFNSIDSMLISEYGTNTVGAYEIDGNGDPIVATRRDFITGLNGAEGAEIDNATGDFLFSTFGGGNRVIVVTGFIPIVPEPGTMVLAGIAIAALASRRRMGH